MSTELFASRTMRAFEAWHTASRHTRRSLIHRWREHLAASAEALSRFIAQETGKPISLSRSELQRQRSCGSAFEEDP